MAINNVTFAGLDPNLLLSFFQAKQPVATAAQTTATGTTAAKTGATAKDLPPWQAPSPSQQAQDAKVLATTNFLNTSNVPLGATTTADAKTEQDNQKLFSLYTAVNTLSYLAKIAGRDTTPSGQLASLNARFQQGLQQIQSFIANTTFNNFTLQAAAQTSNITSTAGIQFGSFAYDTRTLTGGANVNAPLAGLSASDSFTIAVTKGGTTTNVAIDLSQVQGGLSLGNIVSYVNQQLSAGGFTTRFQKVLTSGSLETPSTATFGLQVSPGGNETISLSAAATPSLYLAGNTGTAIGTATTAADQQGRLVKLTNLGTTPNSIFNASVAPTNGTSSAQATQVDASGNVYVIGSATGSFGNQLNQGTQDAYLTKYDSAGNVQWTKLLGSTGTASGFSLALNPAGGVVVTGSTTSDLVQGAVADGNNDSFVAKYDANGNQTWVKQLQTLVEQPSQYRQRRFVRQCLYRRTGRLRQRSARARRRKAAAMPMSPSSIARATSSTKSSSARAARIRFRPPPRPPTAACMSRASRTATRSFQNTPMAMPRLPPVWQSDLGDLQAGGAIGGLTVSGNQLYVSGTTQNGNLTAGGAATVANASSSGTDAFVFNLTDSGSSATPDFVSYVGTGSTDKGGAVTVGSDGTIYLTGSTTGTFAGQNRNVASVSNQFAASLTANGSVNWTHQFGGVDGQSSGAGIAIDTSGASVLDALGLPRGTITLNQSVDLTSQTSLRAGDSFQIQLRRHGRTHGDDHDRTGRDAAVARHQDQHPAPDQRQGLCQLQQGRRGIEDRGQSGRDRQADRRSCRFRRAWRGLALRPER